MIRGPVRARIVLAGPDAAPASGPDRRSAVKELTDLPPGVIGFETTGWVFARHYRDVVEPAVQRAALDGDIRCVVVIDDFDGLSPGAVWRDVAMGLGHLRAWKRVALVTDITWMSCATALFGWVAPGRLKRFSRVDRAAAIAWAAAPDEAPAETAAENPAETSDDGTEPAPSSSSSSSSSSSPSSSA
jgi:hypothetical protein